MVDLAFAGNRAKCKRRPAFCECRRPEDGNDPTRTDDWSAVQTLVLEKTGSMSRFGNLEFGSEFEDLSRADSELKGESHYFADVTSAFEDGRFEHGLRLYAKVLEFNPQNCAAW